MTPSIIKQLEEELDRINLQILQEECRTLIRWNHYDKLKAMRSAIRKQLEVNHGNT